MYQVWIRIGPGAAPDGSDVFMQGNRVYYMGRDYQLVREDGGGAVILAPVGSVKDQRGDGAPPTQPNTPGYVPNDGTGSVPPAPIVGGGQVLVEQNRQAIRTWYQNNPGATLAGLSDAQVTAYLGGYTGQGQPADPLWLTYWWVGRDDAMAGRPQRSTAPLITGLPAPITSGWSFDLGSAALGGAAALAFGSFLRRRPRPRPRPRRRYY